MALLESRSNLGAHTPADSIRYWGRVSAYYAGFDAGDDRRPRSGFREKASFFKSTDGLPATRMELDPPQPARMRKTLQQLHQSGGRGGQFFTKPAPRKPPTTPLSPYRKRAPRVAANRAEKAFAANPTSVVFEDCVTDGTYEAWVEITNNTSSTRSLTTKFSGDGRFCSSNCNRHGLVAPGLSTLLRICFAPTPDTTPGEIVEGQIRWKSTAGQRGVVRLRATMGGGGSQDAGAVNASTGREDDHNGEHYSFGLDDLDMPMGTSTTPSGAVPTGSWVNDVWGGFSEPMLTPFSVGECDWVEGGEDSDLPSFAAKSLTPFIDNEISEVKSLGAGRSSVARGNTGQRRRTYSSSSSSRSSSARGRLGLTGADTDDSMFAPGNATALASQRMSHRQPVHYRVATGSVVKSFGGSHLRHLSRSAGGSRSSELRRLKRESQEQRSMRHAAAADALSRAVDSSEPEPYRGQVSYDRDWRMGGLSNKRCLQNPNGGPARGTNI